MDQGKDEGPQARDFAEDDDGHASIELALVAGLAAALAFTMRQLVAAPLLDGLARAAQALTRALSN